MPKIRIRLERKAPKLKTLNQNLTQELESKIEISKQQNRKNKAFDFAKNKYRNPLIMR